MFATVPQTSGSTRTRLPHSQRHGAIDFQKEDGTTETAVPINFNEVYNLKGRLLTLIDATFTDPEQRKAQKDMVWSTLKGWYEDVERDATWQPEQDHSAAA